MQNHVYDRTLTPRDRFTGSVPVGVCSLPGSSRESSKEPMDTDEGAKLRAKSWKEYASWGVGYTLTLRGIHYIPTPLCSLPGAGGRARVKGPVGERCQGVTHKGDKMPTESPTLLQIPLCVTARPSEEGDPNLHRRHWWILRMIWIRGRLLKGLTLRLDIDSALRRLLRRPKGPRRDGFLPASDGTAEDIRSACMEGTCVHWTRKSWRYIFKPMSGKRPTEGISLWWMRWQGRMYVLRGDALERIPEVASRRRRDELSPSDMPQLLGWEQDCEPYNLEHPNTSSWVHSATTEHFWQGHPNNDWCGDDPPQIEGEERTDYGIHAPP